MVTVPDYTKAIVALGATADAIVAAVQEYRSGDVPPIERADSLPQAVRLCQQLASPGDVILLSPACASYDMFVNYEQRGEQFCELVRNDSRSTNQ